MFEDILRCGEQGGDSFEISYLCQSGNEIINGETLVIPSPSFRIFCIIYCNNDKVPKEVGDALASSLKNCKFFADLQYSPKLVCLNDSYSIELRLKCNIFESVYSELTSLKSPIQSILHIDKIIVEVKYYTPTSSLNLDNFVQTLDYSFCCLVINLECKFPFVFLFYGRKLFQNSYNWMKRDIIEVLEDSEETYGFLLVNALIRLHNIINIKYNTINLMKLISDGNIKTKEEIVTENGEVIEYKRFNDSLGTLRKNAYRLEFFKLEEVESQILHFLSKNSKTASFENRKKEINADV